MLLTTAGWTLAVETRRVFAQIETAVKATLAGRKLSLAEETLIGL